MATKKKSVAIPKQKENTNKKIVGITACAAGIAHTYMAADSLKQTGEKLGYQVRIETQGATGAETALTDEEINNADVVIVASDVKIDTSRFKGKRVLMAGVASAIKDPQGLINRAYNQAKVLGGEHSNGTSSSTQGNTDIFGTKKRNGPLAHIMTGISWAMPLIVACGLLLAIANAIGNENLYSDANGTFSLVGVIWSGGKPFVRFIADIAIAGFKLMVPLFAAYIAYSIGDKPALVPALVCGWIINDNTLLGVNINTGDTGGIVMPIEPGAGFIGAIIVGFLVGYLVKYIRSWKFPKMLKSIVPFLIIPLCVTFVVAIFIRYCIGAIIAQLVIGMFDGLQSLQQQSIAFPIVIAVVICMMMSIDMGGPINKTANIFATITFYQSLSNVTGQGLSMWDANFVPWSGMIAAICVPPLGLWLSTIMFKKKFTRDERAIGKTCLPTGIFGITEGAIPFASADPIRVIPSCMIGCGVTGVVSVLLGAKFIGGVAGPLGLFTYGNTAQFQNNYAWWVFVWLACFWSGAFVAGICLGLLRKKINPEEMAHLNEWKVMKKAQHKNAAANVKLLFTHPKQAIKKIGVYTQASNQKRRNGAIEYWAGCGDAIQKWFELWGTRFARFGKWVSKPFRLLGRRMFHKRKGDITDAR